MRLVVLDGLYPALHSLRFVCTCCSIGRNLVPARGKNRSLSLAGNVVLWQKPKTDVLAKRESMSESGSRVGADRAARCNNISTLRPLLVCNQSAQ